MSIMSKCLQAEQASKGHNTSSQASSGELEMITFKSSLDIPSSAHPITPTSEGKDKDKHNNFSTH